MNVILTHAFKKQYKKRILPHKTLDKRFEERYYLFRKDPSNPILRDHALTGTKKGYRAFSITGDIRVVYEVRDDIAYFLDIGTHNQVY